MLIPEDDHKDFLIYAFRYVLGRRSYAVHTVAKVIRDNWSELSETTKQLFKREISEHVKTYGLKGLGDKCDIDVWVGIMDLED